MTAAKPRNAWVHPIGALSAVLAVVFYATRSDAVGGMAVALLALAGIGAVIGHTRPATPRQQPLPAAGGSLVGVRILHRGGISTVIGDLDAPASRRTVTALDGHGRTERLCVGLDAGGRVVEAARPGGDWAAAEAV